MQNKHDILNQHKKLHRIAYILTKYFFHQKLTPGGPQDEIHGKKAEGEYRSVFDGKYI
jgi:hypothetical protein